MNNQVQAYTGGQSTLQVAQVLGNQNQGIVFNDWVNNFGKRNLIDLTFTADNAVGTADLSDVALFPGCGAGAITTLPAGVTVSGDYASIAAYYDYCQRMKFPVTNIWMQSADTANFDGKLTYGLIMPNGTQPNQSFLQLSGKKVSTGNGFADNININDLPLMVMPNLQVKFSLKKNTKIRFLLTVPELEIKGSTSPVMF